ncbi:hypothetical protein [Frigoribacterium sp. PhB24]|uniref:hypothetical protein n=1 Tax=Frigoribacterium sp. PhB24 TaxID=2485204 RepID=UPI000F479D6A|nr:hypothetical protein [Frigoribacterium sp. PhB24]ROS48946.1 hypothetical protein EDF50_2732 [Frigoribacterium sp. PhB24]
MHEDEHDTQTGSIPGSERTTAEMQRSTTEDSPAVDADTDLDAVQALPGEGGPDDGGDIEVDPDDLNLSGDSIPGHPKPGEADPADDGTDHAAPSHPKPGPPKPRG